MMMKSVFWWRKSEYPGETTDLRQSRQCIKGYRTVQLMVMQYIIYTIRIYPASLYLKVLFCISPLHIDSEYMQVNTVEGSMKYGAFS